MNNRSRVALEEAIAADFDDRAAHAAYADLLQERGDPRGEFIAVQLALEAPDLPAPERERLEQRERELLDRHGLGWLGELTWDFTLATPPERVDRPSPIRFCRGWIESVHVRHATYRLMERLARAPLARCLRRLAVDYAYEVVEYNETGEELPRPSIPPETPLENEFYLALREAPWLANLRSLRVGDIRGADDPGRPYQGFCCSGGRAELLHTVVERTPRLEELRFFCYTRVTPRFDPAPIFRLPLPNLRLLQAYNLFDHASGVLADNPTLTNLTHLLFHSHADDPCIAQRGPYLTCDDLRGVLAGRHLKSLTHLQFRLSGVGDEGCELLARSDLLKRLKVLDLRHGNITDAGVDRLVRRSHTLRKLERLDLSHNAITAEGLRALQKSSPVVTANFQHSADDRNWVYEGDYE